jgi:hypothetical protein
MHASITFPRVHVVLRCALCCAALCLAGTGGKSIYGAKFAVSDRHCCRQFSATLKLVGMLTH